MRFVPVPRAEPVQRGRGRGTPGSGRTAVAMPVNGPPALPNGQHRAAFGPMTQSSMQPLATQFTQQFTQFTQHVRCLPGPHAWLPFWLLFRVPATPGSDNFPGSVSGLPGSAGCRSR